MKKFNTSVIIAQTIIKYSILWANISKIIYHTKKNKMTKGKRVIMAKIKIHSRDCFDHSSNLNHRLGPLRD